MLNQLQYSLNTCIIEKKRDFVVLIFRVVDLTQEKQHKPMVLTGVWSPDKK
jgi:hypothetical protein